MLELADQLAIGEANRTLLFNHIIQNKVNFIGNYAITNKLRDTIYHHKSYPDAKWALDSDEINKWEYLLQEIEAQDPIQKYRWLFKDSYLELPEINRNDDYTTVHRKVLKVRSNTLQEIYDLHGIDGIWEFSQMVECPQIVGETFACICLQNDFKRVLNIIETAPNSLRQFAQGFFCNYTQRFGVLQFVDELKSSTFNEFDDGLRLALTSIRTSETVWQYVETFSEATKSYYWEHAPIGIYENTNDNIFLIGKLNTAHRYNQSIRLIYHTLKTQSIPSQLIVDTISQMLSYPSIDGIGDHYKLAEIIIALDKKTDIDTDKLFFIEFIFYKLLKHYGHSANLRLIDELMSSPQNLMSILNYAYLSSNPTEREMELNKMKQEEEQIYARLALDILWDLQRIPCVDQDYKINENGLNKYIQELRELGGKSHKLKHVDRTIGELLANYPEKEGYPPKEICEIIENLNNSDVNSGFRTRLFNKRGVTVRPALEGGSLEKAESMKYKQYADRLRFTYPVIAEIFDSLSAEYQDMALKEDIRTKIEKMEY